MRRAVKSAPVLILLVWLSACAHQIADYSLQAYENATRLKAETGALIDKAGQPYAQHTDEIDRLNVEIDSAYEFAAGIPNNEISARQWDILRDPERNLYGGFIARWREQGRVSAAYRRDKKRQIYRAFDYIICLEANKQAAKSCATAQQSSPPPE